jgi:ribosomal protein L39E
MDVKLDTELVSLKYLKPNKPIPVFIETKTPLPVTEVEKNAKVLKA